MQRLILIVLLFLLISCRNSIYEIDTSKYKVIRQPVTVIKTNPFQLIDREGLKDKVDVIDSIPKYYGGLTPNIPWQN